VVPFRSTAAEAGALASEILDATEASAASERVRITLPTMFGKQPTTTGEAK